MCAGFRILPPPEIVIQIILYLVFSFLLSRSMYFSPSLSLCLTLTLALKSSCELYGIMNFEPVTQRSYPYLGATFISLEWVVSCVFMLFMCEYLA